MVVAEHAADDNCEVDPDAQEKRPPFHNEGCKYTRTRKTFDVCPKGRLAERNGKECFAPLSEPTEV